MSSADAVGSDLVLKISEAYSAIKKVLKKKRVPMLHGSPAIGKSSLIHQIAKEYRLKVIDLRLSQVEPTDMLGFPYSDLTKMKSGYVPMETFPVEGDELPMITLEDGTQVKANGWLLFLDELTSAKPEVQAAAYKLILDRMVGVHNLHALCWIIGAGNLESDNAIVYPMSTALQTRLVHLKLKLDWKEWVSWAIDHGFDHRITDYIQYRPDNLYTFDPNHTDLTYASPRTWEFNNDMLSACDGNILDPDFRILSTGCVTYGVTVEFIKFCEIYASLPKINDILMAPGNVAVPGEPSILFALAGSLGNHATKDNVDKLMQYVLRLPLEFQVVTLRYINKRDRGMKALPAISGWVIKHGAELF